MAASFRQITSGFSGTNVATTVNISFGATIAAGSVIVVIGSFTSNASTLTVSDNTSDANTDSGLGIVLNSTLGQRIFSKAFLTPSASAQTVTLTWNAAPAFYGIFIYEVAGLSAPVVYDKAVHATGSGTTFDSGTTGTLASSDEAGIGLGVCAGGPTAPGTGWSVGQGSLTTGNNGDGGVGITLAEHRAITTTTAINGTGTCNTGAWEAWCVTLRSVPGLPPGENVYDLPPRAVEFSPRRSWEWSYNRNLIGQDRLPAGKQLYDLPPSRNPPPPVPTGIYSYNLNLIGQDRLPPGGMIHDLQPALLFWRRDGAIPNLLQTTLAIQAPQALFGRSLLALRATAAGTFTATFAARMLTSVQAPAAGTFTGVVAGKTLLAIRSTDAPAFTGVVSGKALTAVRATAASTQTSALAGKTLLAVRSADAFAATAAVVGSSLFAVRSSGLLMLLTPLHGTALLALRSTAAASFAALVSGRSLFAVLGRDAVTASSAVAGRSLLAVRATALTQLLLPFQARSLLALRATGQGTFTAVTGARMLTAVEARAAAQGAAALSGNLLTAVRGTGNLTTGAQLIVAGRLLLAVSASGLPTLLIRRVRHGYDGYDDFCGEDEFIPCWLLMDD